MCGLRSQRRSERGWSVERRLLPLALLSIIEDYPIQKHLPVTGDYPERNGSLLYNFCPETENSPYGDRRRTLNTKETEIQH